MISCDCIRKVLITSYIDKELDENTREEVEKHLAVCPGCMEIKTLLLKDVLEPLESAALARPSSEVWNSIEEEINGSIQEEDAAPVWEKIMRTVLRPVPVAAVSFLAAVCLVLSIMHTSVLSKTDPVVENYFSKHFRFLDYLESDGGDYYFESDHLGLISPIEKYLF